MTTQKKLLTYLYDQLSDDALAELCRNALTRGELWKPDVQVMQQADGFVWFDAEVGAPESYGPFATAREAYIDAIETVGVDDPEAWGLQRVTTRKVVEKRIHAIFQPQMWQNDYAVEVDGRCEVDVTGKVLRLSLEELIGLDDNSYESDDLVDLEELGHNGPFYVSVKDQAAKFFGVNELSEVTQAMLDEARKLVPQPVKLAEESLSLDALEEVALKLGSTLLPAHGVRGMAWQALAGAVGFPQTLEAVGEMLHRHLPEETVVVTLDKIKADYESFVKRTQDSPLP